MAPVQKPGRSKQDYGTPDDFLDAARAYLEIEQFDADLAADDTNAVAWPYFTKERSAFDAPTWKLGHGWNWLNPPFSNIAPWVERAFSETVVNRAHTAVLIPASLGANWWRDWVHGKAMAVGLNGRLIFKGTPPNPKTGRPDAYPKDCALLLYSPDNMRCIENGDWPYDIWSWK